MAKTTWAIDPTHSEVGFKVKHLMFTNVSGKFNAFSASVESEDDDFSTAKISFAAEAASVDTGNGDRDNHLKGADFFDADNHPHVSFAGREMKKVSDEVYHLTGDLTMRGVTHPVTLEVEYGGQMKDPWGNTKAGFSLSGKINRKDFGLVWNAPLEAGGVLVSEEVKLQAEVQFVKQG
ncbi:MAG: YceI family protein [Bacteroidota bacterium]